MLCAGFALTPAQSATTGIIITTKGKSRSASLSAPGSLGSFTPASNPRMAALMARGGFSSQEFRFTPSAAPGSRRAVTVAIRSQVHDVMRARTGTRAVATALAQTSATSPLATSYNLGASVGWKRFVVSGDVARIDAGPMLGERQNADLALGYRGGERWITKVELSADRGSQPGHLTGRDESVAVDVGGSYSLTRNIDVTGGVRYKMQRERLESLPDNRRDSQAVYVGTAFRF